MVLAYDFPLLSLFWTVLWAGFVFSVFFAVIWSFVDNFRRSDHSGWAKAGWALFILVLPLFGMFIYLLARPVSAEMRMTVPASTGATGTRAA